MKFLEYLDRIGERRLERFRVSPPRPVDWRMFIGFAFFAGYYLVVFSLMRMEVPGTNGPLVRDALLVLGPPVGVIVGAMFRSDVRDEIAATNTGEGFRAMGKQADATVAAAAGTPPGEAPPLNDEERPAGTAGDPVHTTTDGGKPNA